MKKFTFIIALLVFVSFFSCKDDGFNYDNLVGEWTILSDDCAGFSTDDISFTQSVVISGGNPTPLPYEIENNIILIDGVEWYQIVKLTETELTIFQVGVKCTLNYSK